MGTGIIFSLDNLSSLLGEDLFPAGFTHSASPPRKLEVEVTSLQEQQSKAQGEARAREVGAPEPKVLVK